MANWRSYPPIDGPEFPHGSTTGYHYGCRCRLCAIANNYYMAEWRRRSGQVARTVRYVPRAKGSRHGTRACYVGGCRQPECVEANRAYQREYMRLYRAGIPMTDPWIEEALK